MKRIEFEDALVIKPAKVSVLDEMPVGTVVDFDGTEIPAGWEEVESEVVLYNGGNASGTVNLSEDLSKFKYIEIFFCDNGSVVHGSQKIYSPNGKQCSLYNILQTDKTSIYIRATQYELSEKTITPIMEQSSYTLIAGSNITHYNGNNNHIRIYRVVGYR